VLTASGLSVAHGARVLFRDVTLQLSSGRRVALIGGNGAGKTTLVECLIGERSPDAGDVHRPKDMRIGYLPQELPGGGEGTVLDEVLRGAADIQALSEELARLQHAMADASPEEHAGLLDDYGHAQARFEQLGGYAIEAEAHRILAGLGFASDDARRAVGELSGGWRMRVSLARLLLSEPDLLVLDEPTNHLDVDSVAWLEQHLAAFPGALLFVSHDRDFIDAVANRVVELAGGVATEYVGGFAEFVAQREERLAALEAAAANQEKQLAQVERFIERFRYKATKARQVQSRVKALDKIDRIVVPTREELQARFQFPTPPRSSREVVTVRHVTAGYGQEPVLRDVDLVIERGRKVAFVGPNGAGKTTLVRLVLGELSPKEGSVDLGANVSVATFKQDLAESLDPGRTVLEEIRRSAPAMDGRNFRTIAAAFGFRGDAVDRRIAVLSGGERTRVALAKTMLLPVNLLVLDEPTNHLDLPSCDMLEDALGAYPGTVILVTHDRHLIRGVADALVEVRDGGVRWHEGVDERILFPNEVPDPPPAPPSPKSGGPGSRKAAPTPPAPSNQERRDRQKAARSLQQKVARVEKQWEEAEAAVAEVQRRLADPEVYADQERVAALVAEHDAAKDRAADLMAQWEKLTLELESLT
jgi:ATP-binding cassette subfamily F protein 3